jgi:hypothetical protein
MAKVYALFYDHDGTGSREEWSTFYTPCEVFDTSADRDVRKDALTVADPDLKFHELDLETPTSAEVAAMGAGPNPGGSGNTDDSGIIEVPINQDIKDQIAEMTAVKPSYVGAPEDLGKAIDRILELELRLDDLHRAAEIAVAVKDFTLIEGQMPEAAKALDTKIVVEYPNNGPMQITVVQ